LNISETTKSIPELWSIRLPGWSEPACQAVFAGIAVDLAEEGKAHAVGFKPPVDA
jgi:hypothetical protein